MIDATGVSTAVGRAVTTTRSSTAAEARAVFVGRADTARPVIVRSSVSKVGGSTPVGGPYGIGTRPAEFAAAATAALPTRLWVVGNPNRTVDSSSQLIRVVSVLPTGIRTVADNGSLFTVDDDALMRLVEDVSTLLTLRGPIRQPVGSPHF